MRLVEVGDYFVNPDRVAYLSDHTSQYGGDARTFIHFSGVSGDGVPVDGNIGDVAKKLTYVFPKPPQ